MTHGEAFISEVHRLSNWFGSLLVSNSEGEQRMMHYASNHVTQVTGAGSYVAHSRVHGSVVARSRAENHLDFQAQNGIHYVSRGQRNKLSYQVRQKGKSSSKTKGSKFSSSPELGPPYVPSSDFNWSPLPRRHASASENLCVALYCDDVLDDTKELSGEVAGPSQSVRPRLPSSFGATTRHRRRQPTLRSLTFADELPDIPDNNSLSPPLSPTLQLRPYTNPRDTPTHHPPTLCSPTHRLAPIPAHDLTLESLHDLNWLNEMEPEHQVILEVHVIWSILSLMVVLLACYTLHHQPLTG